MGRPCCPRQTWMFHKSRHEKLLTNTGVRFLLNRPAGGSNTTTTTKVTLWPRLYFPSRSKKMFLESCRTFPRKPNSLLSTVGEKQLLSGWKKTLVHSVSFTHQLFVSSRNTFCQVWHFYYAVRKLTAAPISRLQHLRTAEISANAETRLSCTIT